MTRRGFLKVAAGLFAIACLPPTALPAEQKKLRDFIWADVSEFKRYEMPLLPWTDEHYWIVPHGAKIKVGKTKVKLYPNRLWSDNESVLVEAA